MRGRTIAEARADIETKGYTIIANVGDQQSDIDDVRRQAGIAHPFVHGTQQITLSSSATVTK